MIDTLLLIDADNFWWRSYHALKDRMDDGGAPAWAVHGTVLSVASVVRHASPSHIAFCSDAGPSKHRGALFEGYKAARRKGGDLDFGVIRPEMDRCRRLLSTMGMFTYWEDGVEADDVIATLTRRFSPEAKSVLISTGDKDLRQLIGENVSVLEPSHAYGSPPRVWEVADVVEHYGVEPAYLPDILALAGDQSDGIPGVRGIGPKGAAKLVQKWGSAAIASALSGDKKLEGSAEVVDLGMALTVLDGTVARCDGITERDLLWDPVLPGDGPAVSVNSMLEDLAMDRVREMWIAGRLWREDEPVGRTLIEAADAAGR